MVSRVQIGRGQADPAQIVQRALKIFLRPVATLQDWNVLLHQAGGVVSGQDWRADQSSCLQHDDGGDGRQQEWFARAAPAPLRANHECGSQGGIDHHDLERQAIHAGHGGKVRERYVVHLADAQQVPGKSGDASAGQFHRDPGEWGEDKRPAAEGMVAFPSG